MSKLNLSSEAQATLARLEEIRARDNDARGGRWYAVGPPWPRNDESTWVNAGADVPALLALVGELKAECERLTEEYVKAEAEANYWRERYNKTALQRDALKPENQLRVGVREELAELLGTNDIAEAVKEVKRLKGLEGKDEHYPGTHSTL